MGVSSMIPMRGIFARCCASAASGHAAAAPPSSVRNKRRFMSNIDFPVLPWTTSTMQGRRALHILLVRRENAPKCLDQPIELDWFGIELVTPCSERLFTLASQCMCGESDDRDIARCWTALQPPRGFPAVDHRHFEVHQDEIRLLRCSHLTALFAVLRRQHFEVAEQLEPHLEHVDVVVIVFDIKNLGHDTASISLLTGGLLCTTRRMRSTRSAARNVSLTSTVCTPEFNRSRSLASRSRAVITTTGISCHAASFCNAATTAKPSISGIIKSSKITSGLPCRRRSSASRPFVASCTVHCGSLSHSSIRSRCRASSSTSSTRVGGAAARKRLTSW